MESTIIYCTDNPLKSATTDWLNNHIGRISVGRRISDRKELEILAYSDNEEDSSALRSFASQQDALYIRSISGEGVTAIDSY